MIYWADALIHMHSRTQSYNTLNSPEAEYGGAVSCAAMMIFLASMLSFLGFKVQKRMYLDASSAIAIAKRQGVGKVKHLKNKILWLQQEVESKSFQILKVPRDTNVADIGTKHLKANDLQHFAK